MGGTITGIVIDPNGKTTAQLNAWLDTLTYDPEKSRANLYVSQDGLNIYAEDYQEDDLAFKEIVVYSDNFDIRYFSKPVEAYGINAAGWYELVEQGASIVAISSEKTFALAAETIGQESIKSDFTFLNGTVIGAQLANLTPFTDGDVISGIVIDPTAKSDDEMLDWLKDLSYSAETNMAYLVRIGEYPIYAEDKGSDKYTITVTLNPTPSQEDPNYGVIYASDEITIDGITLSKGWNFVQFNGEAFVVSLLNAETSLTLSPVEVSDIETAFAFLNGVVLGSVEYEGQVYTITTNVTNGSEKNEYTKIPEDGTVKLIIQPAADHTLPETISVTNASYTYDDTTGVIVLSEPTGNVRVTVVCEAIEYTITNNITNGSASGDNTIAAGSTASVTISPASGYELPSDVTVSGATSSYDSTTGVVSLSNPTGDVTITAECPAEQPVSSLTAFAVNQVIGGYDLGNVSNGDTNSDLATFLSGLTYTDGMYVLVSSNGEAPLVAAMDLSDNNFGGSGYALSVTHDQGGDVVYATAANSVEDESYDGPPTTIGYQNLTDGKYTINTTYTVGTVDDTVSGWNGTLIGAVVSE